MYTAYDIYLKFKEIESQYKGIEFKAPKSLQKLSQEKINKLQKIADFFNTIWQNISIDDYLKVGFEKWKSFNIDRLDDERIIRKYISNDKKKKWGFDEITTDDILKSISYIKENYQNVVDYCKNDRVVRAPINDFVANKIDALTLVFLIEKKYLYPLNEEEKMFIHHFYSNYTEIKQKMYGKYDFIMRNI